MRSAALLELSAFLSSEVAAITQTGLRLLLDAARRLGSDAAVPGAGARRRPPLAAATGVYRIPVFGPLGYGGSFISTLLGWSTVTGIRAELDQALADPSVDTILLEIESPGGTVFGLEELAEAIFQARAKKRVLAFAAPYAASAAYWIGAAATSFYAMPSGQVGSIGVIGIHFDESRALDAAGITPTILATSRYKAEGNELEPLGDEARRHLLATMGDYHRRFVTAIARYRATAGARVEKEFGEGRVLLAPDAASRGMIDGTAVTVRDVLERRPGRISRSAAARAHERLRLLAEADIAQLQLAASGYQTPAYDSALARAEVTLAEARSLLRKNGGSA